jgi:lysozyme family protein
MVTNAERWGRALFTRSTQINAQAEKIIANRSRYELVSKATGVPWDVIGVIHYRESSNDFRGVLHNGQKIIGTGKKTTLVPKGRGPFSTWEEAAIDALANCHPHLAKNKDWSIGNTLDKLESYNGLGYRNKGLPEARQRPQAFGSAKASSHPRPAASRARQAVCCGSGMADRHHRHHRRCGRRRSILLWPLGGIHGSR